MFSPYIAKSFSFSENEKDSTPVDMPISNSTLVLKERLVPFRNCSRIRGRIPDHYVIFENNDETLIRQKCVQDCYSRTDNFLHVVLNKTFLLFEAMVWIKITSKREKR